MSSKENNKEVETEVEKKKIFRFTTMQQIQIMKERNPDKMFVLLFWAKWYPECEFLRQRMNDLVPGMSHLIMGWCNVDSDVDIVEHYEITKVPFILLMHPSKQQYEFIKNPKTATLGRVLGAYEEFYREAFISERQEAFEEIKARLAEYPVVIFIRGTPLTPLCKSSKFLVDSLNKLEIKYRSNDIMDDQRLKEWLKFYANWPSYPQLFINGKFIGGTEVVLQLAETGQLLPLIPPQCIKKNVLARIQQATNQSIVVLFMKGTPDKPADGYQKEAVDLLKEQKIRFTTVNVVPDADLREILKEFAKWPSYPMLYVSTKFKGGLNFIKELIQGEGLSSIIPSSEVLLTPRDKVIQLTNQAPFVLFLKGTIEFPSDPDTKTICDRLKEIRLKETRFMYSYDLSKDGPIEKALKVHSQYALLPQLYYRGQLVGSGDLIETMCKSGQLQEMADSISH